MDVLMIYSGIACLVASFALVVSSFVYSRGKVKKIKTQLMDEYDL